MATTSQSLAVLSLTSLLTHESVAKRLARNPVLGAYRRPLKKASLKVEVL